MQQSILQTIKKLLGIQEDYTVFDTDVIVFINSQWVTLKQIGAGPVEDFYITGSDEKWSEFIGDEKYYASIQTYVYSKVKLLFDPPPTSYARQSLEEIAKEALWRLNVQASTESDSNE